MKSRPDKECHYDGDPNVDREKYDYIYVSARTKMSIQPIQPASDKTEKVHREQQQEKEDGESSECEHLCLAK